MTYDEMHDYEMFNEAAHPARGNLLSIYGIINDITVLMLNERKISVQIYYSSSWPFIASSDCWRDAIWQIRPVSDEAHGAVHSTSGSLRHHGSRFLTK